MTAFQLSYSTVLMALAACYVFRLVWVNVSHFLRARRLGCKPAFVRPNQGPFGIGILQRAVKATREQVLQNDDLMLYDELGQRSTWYQNILGSWHHVTTDPENVQAILATQFNDFELGPLRRGVFAPFIGNGIFTSDGKEWYVV